MQQGSIEVKVRYFGVLELYAGARTKTMILPEKSTLQDLLDLLINVNPPVYQKLFTKKTTEEPFIRVMVNEKLIDESDFSIQLEQNDVVILMPGISGGG
jgi:molybdopterin converting factor small subunit